MVARRHLLSVSRRIETGRDGVNAPVYADQDQGQIWAGRVDLSDVEKQAEGQNLARRVARFSMRFNAVSQAIAVADKLRDQDGRQWQVTGSTEDPRGNRRAMLVTAVEDSGRGAA